MKTSEFLRRKILQMTGGVILNYFKVKKRRDTLYFGEIPAKYLLLCEKKGFGEKVREIGKKWMYLYFSTLLPETFKKIPPVDLLNEIIKKVWINMGVMDDFIIEKQDSEVNIKTKGEGMTELIGKNSFLLGFHEGVLNALYGKEVEILDVKQTRKECCYRFKILGSKFEFKGKDKKEYDKLNHIPSLRGLTLKEMLRRKVFSMKGHKLYFRGKVLYPIENTVIHLFSNECILLDEVPKISYEFFNDILDKNSSGEDRLRLLKNLIQVMGWGVMGITKSKDLIKMKIENPPYGLQKEKDNWDFLIKMILGYVRTTDKNYRIVDVNSAYKLLNIGFSR